MLLDRILYDSFTINNSSQNRSLNMPVFNLGSSKDGKHDYMLDKILTLLADQNKSTQVTQSQRRVLPAVKSEQVALRHIFANFLLLPKLCVSGVSGFLCPKCLKFEAVYIKDLGYDRTMKSRHHCSPDDLENMKLPDFRSIMPAVELEANETLFAMTRLWLQGPTFLNSLLMPFSPNAHSELYVIDLTGKPSDGWIIQYANKDLDDNNLKKFLAIAKSTYAVFRLPDKRAFFMYISPKSQLHQSAETVQDAKSQV